MTLTELLSPVQQLPDEDKIKLIRIFAENLDEAEESNWFAVQREFSSSHCPKRRCKWLWSESCR